MEREDDTCKTEKMLLLELSVDPDFPRQASDVKWRKKTEREEEMERKIELGEERRCERDDGDTGKTMKHKGKHEPKGN